MWREFHSCEFHSCVTFDQSWHHLYSSKIFPDQSDRLNDARDMHENAQKFE